jgi:hypothetical protein
MTTCSTSGRRRSIVPPVSRYLAVAGLILATAIPLVALAAPAGAALRPVTGCGFSFGRTSAVGAAGTVYYSVDLLPANPAQACTTSVQLTASIDVAAALLVETGPYTNIENNPVTATQLVTFAPGRLPPSLQVGWAEFHCADPAVPGSLSVVADGQRAAWEVDPTTCGPGQHSSLEAGPTPEQVPSAVGIASTPDGHGYMTVETGGNITAEGDASSFLPTAYTNAPAVGIAATRSGKGAWVVAADGAVFAYGNAKYRGSTGPYLYAGPVVGIAATPDGGGYWLATADGWVFHFGDAVSYGSLAGVHLSALVVGIAATPDGRGYWLVAEDGGVFSFGDARFDGSLGDVLLNAPIVGIAAGPHRGYWLVASDGGVFAFGGVPYKGSMGGSQLSAPISAIAATPDGRGYWLLGSDNGIFSFGDARFYGSSPIYPF